MTYVVFDLEFLEPGGVTVPGPGDRDAAEERDRAHALLDTGPDGRAHLPGTSLAGALRELAGPERAATWFGELIDPDGEGDGDGTVAARASRIWVLGSERADEAGTLFRTSTRISRSRAAAQANTLRAEEILPAGARFRVSLRWDDAPAGELDEFLGLLAGWRPYLGRGVSRGRGACAVTALRHGTLRLDDPDDVLTWLTQHGPELAAAVATTPVPVSSGGDSGTGSGSSGGGSGDPVLDVTVAIDGPVRVGSGGGPDDSGVIPLLRDGETPVVPGSGLKGLLRSRAEYILRSVGVTPEPCGEDEPCADGGCWTCRVFGYGGARDENAESVGARALIRVADARVRDETRAARTHTAIDRFTGGVLPKALYTMEILEAGNFRLRVSALGEMTEPLLTQARAVLRLVLQDLDDGIIGLGGGVARGYGTVRVRGLSGLSPSLDEARAVLRGMARPGSADDGAIDERIADEKDGAGIAG